MDTLLNLLLVVMLSPFIVAFLIVGYAFLYEIVKELRDRQRRR